MSNARQILDAMIAEAEDGKIPIVYNEATSGERLGFAFGVGSKVFPETWAGEVFGPAHQSAVAAVLREAEMESARPNPRIWRCEIGGGTLWFWPTKVNPKPVIPARRA